jgi:molybdopterin synthase catalytic subunit
MTVRIRIHSEDFDLHAELAALRSMGAVGAVATFTGIVRGGGGLSTLSLEHYPGMTEREIGRHVEKANARWPLLGATIIHRVGKLQPGDNIVLVAVAASHRKAAFEACEFLMDYLKTGAPFWKQEERDGQTAWVEARPSDEAALKKWR